jgi:hypothetical protein
MKWLYTWNAILHVGLQTYLEHLPQFVGRTFGSIALQLPDAIPYGITNPFRSLPFLFPTAC